MQAPPYAMSGEVSHHRKARALGGLLHGARDVTYSVADLRLLASRVERRPRDAQQTLRALGQ